MLLLQPWLLLRSRAMLLCSSWLLLLLLLAFALNGILSIEAFKPCTHLLRHAALISLLHSCSSALIVSHLRLLNPTVARSSSPLPFANSMACILRGVLPIKLRSDQRGTHMHPTRCLWPWCIAAHSFVCRLCASAVAWAVS
jgi:hypothetical protein